MHSSLDNKDLLNFYRPFPHLLFYSNAKVKIIGLRSLQHEAKTSYKKWRLESNPVFFEYDQKRGFDEK